MPGRMNPFDFAHKHAKEITWMSQNTNQIPMTDAIEKAIQEAISWKEYNLYPRSNGIFGLAELLKEHLDLPEDYEVLITNGGIEGLYILTRALLEKGDEVICTDPSFLPIHHLIDISGAKPVEIPIYQKPWKMTPEQIQKAVTPRTKMILLIDPINPLGTAYTEGEIKAICQIAQDNNILVIDDITYRDFSDPFPTYDIIPDKTLVSYTFSKQCGLAGMRIGILAAPKKLMDKMMPYNTNVLSVNILAQRAALAAMEHIDQWLPALRNQMQTNQAIIKEAVDKVDGCFLPVYPSSTNMFVIDISQTGVDPDDLQDKMLYDHKIFVRSGNYVSKSFGENFIRVSFSVIQSGAERFASVFPEVMAQLR